MARNGLSKVHRDYLAAGGLGFFIGDGRLNYRPETVFEAFYNLNLTKAAWITLDWQHIRNPAYNADRGPLRCGCIRSLEPTPWTVRLDGHPPDAFGMVATRRKT